MSIYSRIKKAFTGGNPQVQMAHFGQRGDPPPRGTAEFLQAYDENPWVRAISGRVATSVGETKWVFTRNDTDEQLPPDHLMLRTIRRPNPLMSGCGLIRVTQLMMDIAGDAFWIPVRNGFGAPVELWPIPPHWVAATPTRSNPSFRISYAEWQATIPEGDLIWLHDINPYNPYGRGKGIVQALADEVSGDEFASAHVNQLFFNRAMPEVVVTDDGASDNELIVHERAWNNRLRGLYKAMRPYFTNRKLEFWQPTQTNLSDLTLVPLRTFQRDIQLQCWGVPPEQLGITETSNRATADASDYIFESRVIRPRRQFLAEELTMKLAPMYDPRIEVGFVDTAPGDKEHSLSVMKANTGAFSVDEWRAAAGLTPCEEYGSCHVMPLNSYMTDNPMDHSLRPNQPGAAPNIDEVA